MFYSLIRAFRYIICKFWSSFGIVMIFVVSYRPIYAIREDLSVRSTCGLVTSIVDVFRGLWEALDVVSPHLASPWEFWFDLGFRTSCDSLTE
ncbi:hypothetical protein RchiOBHm_Chr6g0264671 [Rosa chinensis]|uniref:Uncharacterized protein n=1 Tax=Rosa chinensis TaxID=74649 RepID=A0A2P6PP81_ROSCH|nr:hypothetical protein RchiOBHm_Chr6g0264671 [Rosa chinensis]